MHAVIKYITDCFLINGVSYWSVSLFVLGMADVPENRKWMDNRLNCNKHLTAEYLQGIHDFI